MKKFILSLLIFCTFAMGFDGGCFYLKYSPEDRNLQDFVSGLKYNSLSDGFIHRYYLIAGEGGKIYRSSDPETDPWTLKISGTTNNINSIKIEERTDTAVTFGAGDNGTIIRSLDEGMTWTVLNSSTNKKLNGICFLDLNNLITVGDSGTILKSSNGGDNWTAISSGVTKNLNSIFSLNAFISIIAGDGGTLLRTPDGGLSWQNISLADTSTDLNKIGLMGSWFFGRILGIVGDNGTLYQSYNYINWNPIETGTTEDLYDLKFKNASSGFVAGNHGTIKYTTDGGNAWYSDFFLKSLTDERITATLILNDTTAAGVAGNEVILIHASETLLPVELSAFVSFVQNNDVTLKWTTASETNNSGFKVERSAVTGQTSDDWMNVGFVRGNGTASTPNNYQFTDRGLSTGKYNYRLKQIDFNGNYEYYNLINEVEIGIPDKFSLYQNYPNPFNPVTKIKFSITGSSGQEINDVTLTVYDINGKEIDKLYNGKLSPGSYEVTWNAGNYSSGVYFYKLNSQGLTETKKMTLIK